MRHSIRRSSKWLLGLGLVFGASSSAWGQTTTWTDATGGLWNTPASWSAGVPVAAGTAQFSTVTGSYTVTFNVTPTTANLSVLDGNVTFAMAGQSYFTGAPNIGNTSGLNGRLTVLNGLVNTSGAPSIGNTTASTGSLTISTGASWITGGSSTLVGTNGAGTLTINNGGSYSGAALFVGFDNTGSGTLSVTGAGSSLTLSNSLIVGNSGTGTATISAGAIATGTTATIGNLNNGSLTVTGAGAELNLSGALNFGSISGVVGTMTISNGGSVSNTNGSLTTSANAFSSAIVSGSNSKWTNSGTLNVGGVSGATLDITNGGAVSATTLFVGGSGSMSMAGTNSQFVATGAVTIGNTGNGTLNIGTGATFLVGGTTTVSTNIGTLNLQGGSFETNGFIRNGTVNHNDGLLLVRGAYDHGGVAAPLIIDGSVASALPTLRLNGNFAVTDVTSVTVGNNNRGVLIIDGGRTLNTGANAIAIGAGPNSDGSVTVIGNNSLLQTTATLAIGGSGANAGGTGTLTVGPGAVVTAPINLFATGTLNLNGGAVNTSVFNANGGSVNFAAGNFNLTATTTMTPTQLTALLGPSLTLGGGQVLSINTGTMTLGGNLTVNGGLLSGNAASITNNATLRVQDGKVDTTVTLTNNAGKLITVAGTGELRAGSLLTNSGEIELQASTAQTSGGTLSNNGTLRGTGTINNNLQNNAAGRVDVTTGQRLVFKGASNTNSGIISMVGGEIQFNNAVTNSASTGLISGRDAILRTGGITNNGSMAFSNGSMDVFGDITQNVGGRITITGGGTANFYDDVTIAPGAASVQASAAGGTVSKVVFFGSYNGGVTGGGTAFIEGDHRPGNSPGLVTFGGDVFYGSLAKLFVELGGINRGSQYDAIDVAGSVTVNGDLNLVLINSFVPTSGQSFLIINNDGSDPINGIFNGLPEGATFTSGDNLFQISYAGGSGNDLTISAVPEPTTWALLGFSAAGAGYYWRRRQQQQKQQWEADAGIPVA